MTEQDPDRDIRQFLQANVASYDQLQSLLLMAKSPGTRWSAKLLAEKLGLPPAAAQTAWQHLVRRQLVGEIGPEGDARFAYTEDRAALVERLDRICNSEPHVVLKWMNA